MTYFLDTNPMFDLWRRLMWLLMVQARPRPAVKYDHKLYQNINRVFGVCRPLSSWYVMGLWLKFAPNSGSLSTVKTNHKIVILFTGENFIAVMGGGDRQKKFITIQSQYYWKFMRGGDAFGGTKWWNKKCQALFRSTNQLWASLLIFGKYLSESFHSGNKLNGFCTHGVLNHWNMID